jgi:hypothetical protein
MPPSKLESDPEEADILRELRDDTRLPRPGGRRRGALVLAMRSFQRPSASRFTDGSFGVLYAAMREQTCMAEMVYHLGRYLNDSPPAQDTEYPFRLLNLSVSGRLADIRKGHKQLHHPDDYRSGQLFGRTLWEKGHDGIHYRSVRDPGGECLALLSPTTIGGCTQDGTRVLRWNGNRVVI